MNTSDVVLAVSTITPYMVLSMRMARQPLHTRENIRSASASAISTTPSMSLLLLIAFTLTWNCERITAIATIATTAMIAG